MHEDFETVTANLPGKVASELSEGVGELFCFNVSI